VAVSVDTAAVAQVPLLVLSASFLHVVIQAEAAADAVCGVDK